jgi:hypothetical protein
MENSDDFSMFANSTRVVTKKNEAQNKSPFSSASYMIKETYETPLIKEPVIVTAKAEVKREEKVEEEVSNVGSELQKFRKYPKKSFDKCINKMVLFNEEEYFLIREFQADLSMARRKSTIKNKDTLPRITENTIIRSGMKALLKHIAEKKLDYSTLQTEDGLTNLFNSILK